MYIKLFMEANKTYAEIATFGELIAVMVEPS